MESQYTTSTREVNAITPIVSGIEQLQKLRIQTGNRVAAINIQRRRKLILEATTEEEKEAIQKEYDNVINGMVMEYRRITDAMIESGYRRTKVGIIPSPKKFVPTELINTYSELVLVDQYVRYLDSEETNMAQLERALEEVPVYNQYLKNIPGVGPKLAGVILSEYDIHRSKYVEGMWRYAGLDTVIYGEYVTASGEVKRVSFTEISEYYKDKVENEPMTIGGYLVTFKTKGRGRDAVSLVTREYVKADGTLGLKNSITFNPFLKTKLIGVLGASLLKQTYTTVDGDRKSTAEREEMAIRLGMTPPKGLASKKKLEVIIYLREQGFDVVTQMGEYARIYYNYRDRLTFSKKPEHQGLTKFHIHNMAVRYMVKEFIRKLYVVWRSIEGLPIYKSYAEAKLGYTHDSNQKLYREWNINPKSLLDYDGEPEAVPAIIADYVAERDVQVGVIN